MEYISVKEAASRWGISERRVRALCESGRIEGVAHVGDWVWSIPASTERPADGRTLRYMKNRTLRTGIQNFADVDKIKKSSKNSVLSEKQKLQIVLETFAFDEKEFSEKQISSVFSLKPENMKLEDCIAILNMRGAINMLPADTTEKSLCNLNRRLLLNIDEKSAGKLKDDDTAKKAYSALFKQYAQDWSILHPVVRASFMFTELLRIQPFEKANTQTAFAVLTNEMLKAKLPPVIFNEEERSGLKAALASAKLRGNTQQLVSMIIEALVK